MKLWYPTTTLQGTTTPNISTILCYTLLSFMNFIPNNLCE